MFLSRSSENLVDEQELTPQRKRRSSSAAKRESLFDSTAMVLLGTGFSGKSTFLKNLNLLEEGFAPKFKKITKDTIYSNICLTFIELYEDIDKIEFEKQETDALAKKLLKMLNPQFFIDVESNYNSNIHELVLSLWKDDVTRGLFYNNTNILIPDGVTRFFEDLNRIDPKTFEPDSLDYLYAQRKTVGISHSYFSCLGGVYDVVDTAGQRSERFKWDYAFENAKLIFYVIPMNAFDQASDDKKSLNRMKDVDRVFSEISNTKQLEEIPIFLILNKCDLLHAKLKKNTFKKFYPDYTGKDEFDDVFTFLEDKLLNYCKFYSKERIFVLPSIGVVPKIAVQTLQSTTKIYSLFEGKSPNIAETYQGERDLLMKLVKEQFE